MIFFVEVLNQLLGDRFVPWHDAGVHKGCLGQSALRVLLVLSNAPKGNGIGATGS